MADKPLDKGQEAFKRAVELVPAKFRENANFDGFDWTSVKNDNGMLKNPRYIVFEKIDDNATGMSAEVPMTGKDVRPGAAQEWTVFFQDSEGYQPLLVFRSDEVVYRSGAADELLNKILCAKAYKAGKKGFWISVREHSNLPLKKQRAAVLEDVVQACVDFGGNEDEKRSFVQAWKDESDSSLKGITLR